MNVSFPEYTKLLYTNSPNKCKFWKPRNAFFRLFLLLPPSDCYCVFLFFTSLFALQLHLYWCLAGVSHYHNNLRHLPLCRGYHCTKQWLQAGGAHWHVRLEKSFPPNWLHSLSNWSAYNQSTKLKTCVCDVIAGAKPCLDELFKLTSYPRRTQIYLCEIVKLVSREEMVLILSSDIPSLCQHSEHLNSWEIFAFFFADLSFCVLTKILYIMQRSEHKAVSGTHCQVPTYTPLSPHCESWGWCQRPWPR
jgi:hypothetical protein